MQPDLVLILRDCNANWRAGIGLQTHSNPHRISGPFGGVLTRVSLWRMGGQRWRFTGKWLNRTAFPVTSPRSARDEHGGEGGREGGRD